MSSSPIPIRSTQQLPSLFHILSTSTLEGSEMLVTFADGSSAVYDAEELEKLRPTPKRIYPPTGTAKRSPFADVA
ncbi:MAG TPA: hypothetical protein VN678_10040 [Acidobacteriaceae bacterium]|nr:hypothetical protein [Acidobacteriaceae bacterium]